MATCLPLQKPCQLQKPCKYCATFKGLARFVPGLLIFLKVLKSFASIPKVGQSCSDLLKLFNVSDYLQTFKSLSVTWHVFC